MDADTGKTELASSPEREQVKLNILIVDDEPFASETVERHIGKSTIASQVGLIKMAANGQEALDILEKNKGGFNTVLTDGEMTVMGGLELARKIKASGENITVGLMSGNLDRLGLGNSEMQVAAMKDYGITAVLPKPYFPPEFEEFMQKVKADVTARNAETQAPNPQ